MDRHLEKFVLTIVILQEYTLPGQREYSITCGKRSERTWRITDPTRELWVKQEEKILWWHIKLLTWMHWLLHYCVGPLNSRDKSVQQHPGPIFLRISPT